MGIKKALLLPLALGACFTPLRPEVSLDPGVSLKNYKVFVVGPVSDQTGAPFDLDVTDSLRHEIADRLRSHGLQVVGMAQADTSTNALLITSTLIGFRGMSNTMEMGGPGGSDTMCRLRGELQDVQTGHRLGMIVAADLGGRRPMILLNECAHDLADEIFRQQQQH
jgi:hypothetical protein